MNKGEGAADASTGSGRKAKKRYKQSGAGKQRVECDGQQTTARVAVISGRQLS